MVGCKSRPRRLPLALRFVISRPKQSPQKRIQGEGPAQPGDTCPALGSGASMPYNPFMTKEIQ